MNITTVSSNLDWKTNNKGTWKALIKDLEPNGTITFSEGYTAAVSGRMVTVSNSTKPVGTVTYATDDTNTVNTGVLYGAGTAYDSVEAVAGDKTVRMGSVDLGTLTWKTGSTQGYFYCDTFSDIASGVVGMVVSSKLDVLTTSWASSSFNSYPDNIIGKTGGNKILYVKCTTFTNTQATEFKAYVSGVVLYYELATPTTSTETPQSLSLTEGNDTLSAPSFDTTYEGTDYSIPLIRNCKYIFRDSEGADTLIQGTTTNTSVDVTGGVNKLINLTHWFGRSKEPTIAAFYDLYPTWKNYDIPYDQGSILNYKGTGVQTIGFNAYNHVTGTAALLGGNQYQICGAFTSLSYVDVYGAVETITLDSENRFTPVNNGILTVTGGNNTDTLVHLCWSGYKNFGKPEYRYEPFISNIKDFPVATYFPDGMNGIGDVSDELTAEQKILCYRVIDLGTLTWTYLPTYSCFQSILNDCALVGGDLGTPIACSRYVRLGSGWQLNNQDPGINLGGNALNGFKNTLCVKDLSIDTTDPVTFGKAVAGVILIYELATPVVTQLDQPLNLAYPVNDFGTEHSLPKNTTTLTTTDLKALIKYNTDYMRMNSQLAEIFPTVKSLAKQEQDGYIMKIDSYAPNARVGAADNLIDKNAEGTPAEFTYRTAGGDVDLTDGTAVAKKSMGTTLNLNQLVKDSVEKEESSSNGVVEVTDAVAGDALALRMTAPRSVVVNQQVQNGNFSDEMNGWILADTNKDIAISSWSVSSNVASVVMDGTHRATIKNAESVSPVPAGHICLVKFDYYVSSNANNTGFVVTWSWYSGIISVASPTVGEWRTVVAKSTTDSSYKYSRFCFTWGQAQNTTPPAQGETLSLRNIQVIDLTQYFNGDQTLIDSITSWDDLVAYDPRFAQYVKYNTGTVTGVQPQVKVTGKNLCDPSIFTANGAVLQSDGSYYWENCYAVSGKNLVVPPSGYTGSVTVSGKCKYISGVQYDGARIVIRYTDDTSNAFSVAKDNEYHDFSITSNPNKVVKRVYMSYGISTTSTWWKDIQIELGSTATSYEPYHDGGTATAPAPLFAVGNAADEFEAVAGRTIKVFKQVDLSSLTWTAGEGTYSATIADIKPSTQNILLPNGYAGTVSGTTLTITASATPSGTAIYESATHATSITTPTQITLQAGNNTAMQTDGGRTVSSIALGYVGTDYTQQTNASRVYLKVVDGTAERVTSVSSVSVRSGRDNLIDLTRMFGAGLEPGTLDAFYSLFPAWRGYRLPYNKGSLLNFKGTGLKSVGFNLLDTGNRTLGQPQNTGSSNTKVRGPFDETKYYVGFNSSNYYYPENVAAYSVSSSSIYVKASTGNTYGLALPIRIVPGMTYRIENFVSGKTNLSFYTYNGTWISTSAQQYVEAPANSYWCLVIYGTNNYTTGTTFTDPCVHLQWSGTRNGDYEPYWDYVRPIPTLTYFPDGMNGRGGVYDEINPRQAVKRFGKVDLGTLEWTWTSNETYGFWTSSSLASDIRKESSNNAKDVVLVSDLYTHDLSWSANKGDAAYVGRISVSTAGNIAVNNGSTTESPTGWLVYELATPVVTTFPEEISATARISDYGTEECLPTNGYDPVTAPFRGLVLYQDDYARTITKLPENYQSQASMNNLLTLIGPLLNGTITATFDSTNQVYTYQFTPNA